MKHKLGICIPYRDREEHLSKLIPSLSKILNDSGIEHKYYVAHQVDDKLLNRGALKNVAAEYALKDGCDYIAWHDVDMIPLEGCDYSYPEEFPIHIATKLSKYNYGLGYDQYFGGVILFNKEHIDKTNGYSNEYWDWGQEDDDLFWRCYFEGYTTGRVIKKIENKVVANFNGDNSYISIPTNREISSCLHNDFTISITFNPEQQPEKVPIWLVGDKNKRFIEYPLFRKEGSFTWGLSFNNSRAITMLLFDRSNGLYYNWGKRFEGMWSQVTLSYNSEEQNAYFYINDELICQMDGIKQNIPFPVKNQLKTHDSIRPFTIGTCKQMNTFFKGKVSNVSLYNQFFSDINDMEHNKECQLLDYDFSDGIVNKVNGEIGENYNVNFTNEDVEIIENIVPYRREGKFYCLPHPDEGYVNGNWVKGETTARNEKRLVTEMQQQKINHKTEGLNSLKYILVSTELFTDNCLMINVKL